MASKKYTRPISHPNFKRERADPASLYPAARVRAELTLSGAFQVPPSKPVKKGEPRVKKTGDETVAEPIVVPNKSADAIEKEEKAMQDAIEHYKTLLIQPTSKSFNDLEIECPVMLVHQDEDVLVALLTIAASSSRRTKHTSSSVSRKCLKESNPSGSAISIDVLRSELLDLLSRGRNHYTYESLCNSLVRLGATQLKWSDPTFIPDEDIPIRGSNLIGFKKTPWRVSSKKKNWIPPWSSVTKRHFGLKDKPKEQTHDGLEGSAVNNAALEPPTDNTPQIEPKKSLKEDYITWTLKTPLTIVICPYLSLPILDPKTKEKYGLHWIAERSSLGPSARCLYSQIAAIAWPGSTIKTKWDTLVERLYSTKPNDKLRGTATRLLKSMPHNWKLVIHGTGARSVLEVTRPPIKGSKTFKIGV